MVLLVDKLFHTIKFPFKLENHHHYEASLEASLQAFRSYISISKLETRSDFVSLSWIGNCFDYMLNSNKAFAKLVVEIDYPVSKWEDPSIEEYLNYSLRVLDLLNSVKYSLSHVSQARVSMSHTLGLIESSVSSSVEQLRSFEFKNFEINLKLEEDVKDKNILGKDSVIHQASMELKNNSDSFFGIILSSLSGDIKPYLELNKSEKHLKYFEGFMEKNPILKEFIDYNEAKTCLVGAMEKWGIGEAGYQDVKNLETKLEETQKHLDDIERKADDLFSEVLAGRNEVLGVFRHRIQ